MRKRSATPIQNREKMRAVVRDTSSVVRAKEANRKRGVAESSARSVKKD